MEKVINNSDMVVGFQNGNVVITPEIFSYVSRYQNFLRKTAESIIGLSVTLIEAEESLNDLDFSIFCDQVGIKINDSTYSKLKKIGQNAARFSPFVDRLPNSWTTIYKLSKLQADQFDLVAPTLTPYTTSKQIDQQVGGIVASNNKKIPDLKIDFGSMSPAVKKELYLIIDGLKTQYNFSMVANNSFISEIKELTGKQAA